MATTRTRPVLVIIYCVLLACEGCSRPQERNFVSRSSPSGRYTVTVTVTEPWMPYGRFKITAYVKDQTSGHTERVIQRTLENDGVPFTEQNIALRWISEHIALLCLRSTDLQDEGVRITVNGHPAAEIVEEC